VALVVATAISETEARARLASRFVRWPRAGLRWSTVPGYGIELEAGGFTVRSLPRLTGSPLYEAIGRWRREGGAEVVIAPMAVAYMPLVIMNTFFLVVLFGTIALSGMRGNILGTIEGVSFFGVILITVSLLAQFAIVALLERRSGASERAALLSALREALGP
jgi:hypothetical protein